MTAIEVGLAAVFTLAGAWRLHRRLGPLHRGSAGAGAAVVDWPRVSIIVPARNEAHNLPALLASLARLQPAPAEIIVVDDHSTDGTGDIARAAGATVVVPPPLPPGWLGKPWACAAGARVASGDHLLFTDADTTHATDSLARTVAEAQRTQADLVSVVPTHAIVTWWERLQGVFQVLLLVATRAAAGLGDATGATERAFCIGQYLLFKRATYEAMGGHARVRDRVAEDLAFCRLVREHGGRYALVHAHGLLTVRMYPEGLAAFIRGWRRNFREGLASAGLGGIAELSVVLAWLLGVPLWLLVAASAGQLGVASGLFAAYLGTALLLAHHQRLCGRFSRGSALAYPLFTVLFVAVSTFAAVDRVARRPVSWRGRRIPRPAGAP